ncbi:MAG: DUF6340 family protein [Bacteroidota bacterium]
MKTGSPFLLLCFSIFALISLQNCGTTMTQMEVLQPAEFSIPSHLEVIVTLDRSKPRGGFGSFLEGTFSGEDIGQDRRGRQSALDGLTNALTRTPRFQVRSSGLEMTGSRGGQRMDAPLPWSEIERIADRHQADAVLVLESYDSDQYVRTRTQKYTEKNKDGEKIERIRHIAEGNMRVNLGWRLYDPSKRIIIDEFNAWADADVNGRGATEQQARADLPDQVRVARDVSYDAGIRYGMRIAPVWITVNRSFYRTAKGADKEPMQRADRFVKSDNWKEAVAIWEDLSRSATEAKTAGKAAHNVAVAHERYDRLELALDWAEKAYTQYGNKSSRSYIQELQQRLNDKRKVEMQMNN